MKKLEVIKAISTIKLENALNKTVRTDWKKMKRIVWGAGVSGKSFVDMYSDIGFSYIVDTRLQLQATTFEGLEITSPENLYEENPDNTIVFLPTILCQDLALDLNQKGFHNIIIPNQLNKSGIGFVIDANKVNDFFMWMNDNKINYVLLRWYNESLMDTKDVDIMIESDDIDKLLECKYILQENQSDKLVYLDIKWSKPIGLNLELPYFPVKLTSQILNSKNILLKNGINIIKDEMAIYSYIYHILFQKAENSNLEVTEEKKDLDNKYFNILRELSNSCNLKFEISLEGLWGFIMNSKFKPPIDFVRKWAAENNSPFLKKKSAFIRPKERTSLAVFIFRAWYEDHEELLNKSVDIIVGNGFQLKDLIYLNAEQKRVAKNEIRGGVWMETYDSRVGGFPYALGVFEHLNASTRKAKEEVREFVSESMNKDINCIHASDDEVEAIEYLDIIKYKNSLQWTILKK